MNMKIKLYAIRSRNAWIALALALGLSGIAQASPVNLVFSGRFFPAAPTGFGSPPSPFDGLDYELSFAYDPGATDVEPNPAEGAYLNLLSDIFFSVAGTRFSPISLGPFDSLIGVSENLARPGVPAAGIPPLTVSGLSIVMAFAGAPFGVPDFSLNLQSAEFACTPALPGFCGPRRGALPGNDLLPQSAASFLDVFNDPANAAGRVLGIGALDPALGDLLSAAATVDSARVPEPPTTVLWVLSVLGMVASRRWTSQRVGV